MDAQDPVIPARRAARATLHDVAASAGVSTPTVSKVLNGRADVAPGTRARVQAALVDHGYAARRRTRSDLTPVVDLVLPGLDSLWAVEVLSGADTAATAAGVGLSLTTASDRRALGAPWLEQWERRRSTGVVLVDCEPARGGVARLARHGAAVVLLDPVGTLDPTLPTVGTTNWSGGLTATEHLLGLGHRRIAMMTGGPELTASQERLDGFRAAMGRAGVDVDERLVVHGDFNAASGRAAAAELLALADPPTAVFAGSDMQASGVYQEVRSRGLRVPDDLSVVGFDDLSICEFLSPPLTTVHQPLVQMAGLAVQMVVDAAQRAAAGAAAHGGLPPHVQLRTRLTLRESTGPVPDRAPSSSR